MDCRISLSLEPAVRRGGEPPYLAAPHARYSTRACTNKVITDGVFISIWRVSENFVTHVTARSFCCEKSLNVVKVRGVYVKCIFLWVWWMNPRTTIRWFAEKVLLYVCHRTSVFKPPQQFHKIHISVRRYIRHCRPAWRFHYMPQSLDPFKGTLIYRPGDIPAYIAL